MANKKMTYAEALTFAIENADFPAEVVEKLTAQQEKNEVLKAEIVEFLADTPDTGYTVTDLLKEIPALEGDSNQHVSAVMRQLVQADRVERYTEKRRTYFRFKG